MWRNTKVQHSKYRASVCTCLCISWKGVWELTGPSLISYDHVWCFVCILWVMMGSLVFFITNIAKTCVGELTVTLSGCQSADIYVYCMYVVIWMGLLGGHRQTIDFHFLTASSRLGGGGAARADKE